MPSGYRLGADGPRCALARRGYAGLANSSSTPSSATPWTGSSLRGTMPPPCDTLTARYVDSAILTDFNASGYVIELREPATAPERIEHSDKPAADVRRCSSFGSFAQGVVPPGNRLK